jgi:hypothetical protein
VVGRTTLKVSVLVSPSGETASYTGLGVALSIRASRCWPLGVLPCQWCLLTFVGS